jgi:hypothetical protein
MLFESISRYWSKCLDLLKLTCDTPTHLPWTASTLPLVVKMQEASELYIKNVLKFNKI